MPKANQPKTVLLGKVKPARTTPLWTGPTGNGPNGGVTQGLCSRWLACRERFRLLVTEGWKPADRFTAVLEFGNLWHAAEEALAAKRDWVADVERYGVGLIRKYPLQQQEIEHWYKMCVAMFPEYVDHWQHHPDVKDRVPLLQEQVFDVPLALPSGRVARLRGKWDSVDLIGKGKDAAVFIQENKTKSQLDAVKVGRQMQFDLQSMTYVTAAISATSPQGLPTSEEARKALRKSGLPGKGKESACSGVRYNVIRRSSHKSTDSMLKKLTEDREDGRIGEWFARWKVEITSADVARFRRECLDPVLENMADDHEWFAFCMANRKGADVWNPEHRRKVFPLHQNRHFRFPFGVWNPTLESGSSELDQLLETGSTAGLVQTTNLFPELQQGA